MLLPDYSYTPRERALCHLLAKLKTGPNEGKKNVDSMLGLWAQNNQLAVYFHTPSLAQHIGQTSVVWPRATAGGRRQASDFVGETFDALTLPELARVPASPPLPSGEGRGEDDLRQASRSNPVREP